MFRFKESVILITDFLLLRSCLVVHWSTSPVDLILFVFN